MTVLYDGMEDAEETKAGFIEALGGDPEEDAPFGQETDEGRDIPEDLYVTQDAELLNWIRSNMGRKPLGLFSPVGTGKTTLSLILERELPTEKFVIATLRGDSRHTTKRQVCELVLKEAFEHGYEIDEDRYTAIRDGIPHATSEAETAVEEVIDSIVENGQQLLFIVDQVEKCKPELFDVIQQLSDKGALLFITGTPAGKDHLKEAGERAGHVRDRALYDRLEIYPDTIKSFSTPDIGDFFGRAFLFAAAEDVTETSPEARQEARREYITDDAVEAVEAATGGRPRAVRRLASDLFFRAANQYEATGDLEAVEITAEDVAEEAAKGEQYDDPDVSED